MGVSLLCFIIGDIQMDHDRVHINAAPMSCGIMELSSISEDVEGIPYQIATRLYHPSRLVFVYGSLKRGFGSHHIIRNSTLITADARTVLPYAMVHLGGFPGVLKSNHQSIAPVFGEVYSVDDDTLRRLDILESNGSFYQREAIPIQDMETGNTLTAWMYFLMRGGSYEKYIEAKDGVLNWSRSND